jgi:hypothetical protein
MDEVFLAKVFSVFLLSTVKFLFAPGTAIASGLTPFQTIVITSLGGMTGITIFYFFGHWVFRQIDAWRYRNLSRKEKKVFTRRNRYIVKFKLSFGLIGLIIVTPAILSIPIGSVVAAKFYYENRYTYPLLLASTIVWSIGLTVFSATVKDQFFG